jgi:hypothetical protein
MDQEKLEQLAMQAYAEREAEYHEARVRDLTRQANRTVELVKRTIGINAEPSSNEGVARVGDVRFEIRTDAYSQREYLKAFYRGHSTQIRSLADLGELMSRKPKEVEEKGPVCYLETAKRAMNEKPNAVACTLIDIAESLREILEWMPYEF